MIITLLKPVIPKCLHLFRLNESHTDNRVYHFDCAIVGAGLSGLICAQHLQESGLRVVVLDKSRGVGGRLATRRLHNSCVDHGLPYLTVQGEYSQKLIEQLREHYIVKAWSGKVFQFSLPDVLSPLPDKRYIAGDGMTTIAKFLARDLEIRRSCRVSQLSLTEENCWLLTCDSDADISQPILAKTVILAIPAPQALMILETSEGVSFEKEFLAQLRGVEFDPTISVMCGYSPQYQSILEQLPWQGVKFVNHAHLASVALDSSKRDHPSQPMFMVHSTPQFAQEYLDAVNLDTAGEKLLESAAEVLLPALNQPQWVQVHRWRYAFPRLSLAKPCLFTSAPLPLACCGDWCGDNLLESALSSGIAAAAQIKSILP